MLLQGTDIPDEELLGVLRGFLSSTDVAELGRILGEQRDKRRF